MGLAPGVFGVDNPGPILSFLPTMLAGILFGLAMDYMLFLGSGMREAYAHGAPARLAVVQGFHAGRSVVTAAAIIMIAVFGGFVFSESAMIRPIGFGLAFGVLVDAFVVRMLIVPALMHLAGRQGLVAARLARPARCRTSTSRARPSSAGTRTRRTRSPRQP